MLVDFNRILRLSNAAREVCFDIKPSGRRKNYIEKFFAENHARFWAAGIFKLHETKFAPT